MPFTKTDIEGVLIFEPAVFGDDRGHFFESYNQRLFRDNGILCDFIQDNQSLSGYGTIRGLHFQTSSHAQAKLVRVLQGSVLDVAVDLRTSSKTFGHHVAMELSDDNKKQLFIPRGFAHGFSVLSETAVFAYKCDNDYTPQSEAGIAFNDPDINIDWRIPEGSVIISDKDKGLPSWDAYKAHPCF